MVIKSAEFVISNSRVEKCPTTGLPEYAFIGRSNVGKSSLINMLTARKGLAMTSQKPGKTQLINHFIINDAWYLVDLPGYGYARLGKDSRDSLRRMIEDYVLERKELVLLFVLLDCRHDPQKIDLEFIQWLGEEGVPFALVFTRPTSSARVVSQPTSRPTRPSSARSGRNFPRSSSPPRRSVWGVTSSSATSKKSTLHYNRLHKVRQ